MDLNDFPFDTHTLRIQLASFEYGPPDVVFAIDETETGRMVSILPILWRALSLLLHPQDLSSRPLDHATHHAEVEMVEVGAEGVLHGVGQGLADQHEKGAEAGEWDQLPTPGCADVRSTTSTPMVRRVSK